jgi:hypothetical protein
MTEAVQPEETPGEQAWKEDQGIEPDPDASKRSEKATADEDDNPEENTGATLTPEEE